MPGSGPPSRSRTRAKYAGEGLATAISADMAIRSAGRSRAVSSAVRLAGWLPKMREPIPGVAEGRHGRAGVGIQVGFGESPVRRLELVAPRLPVREAQGREDFLMGAAAGDDGAEHAP